MTAKASVIKKMEAQIKQLMEMHKNQQKAVDRFNEGKKLIETIQASLERWKLIDGYDNYSVSTYGRVRNDDTGKLLKCAVGWSGYHTASLWKNNIGTSILVHRLVAIAFITNPTGKPFVDHIDNDKLNNKLNNLRWVTQSQNMMNQSMRTDNHSGVIGVSWDRFRNKWAVRLRHNGLYKYVGRYNSIEEAKSARIKAVSQYRGEFAHSSQKVA